MTAKGAARWVRLSADIECEDGEPVRIFGLKQDITQEKDLLQRLQRLAECDPLTGIPNRSVFHARLQAAIGEAAEGRRLAALLLVDLDGFKQVNDTFGHLAGDECLRQVAARLQSTLGSDCFVARIGGDEFALLIYGARLPAEVEGDADALIRAIQQPAVWNGQTSRLGASIGIAIPEWTTRNPAQLFTQADLALYAAKKAGRNTYRVFTSRLSPRAALGDPAHPVWF
jgi:diguanylate cyclase (GGDEF)-like protein